MPTATKGRNSVKKALTDYYLYAPLGAGQLVVEKSKDLSKNAWKQAQKRRRAASKAYYDLAKRGEKLASSVRRSVYTRRAMDQAKATRSQLKATVTGMRKTARATGQATKAATKKVG